ncbi:uncharacterized protein LOC133195229 [Saccostrea echinata]|uniref:uncharacterized protein LOC133195229 n=1 Tax=Saccostrea echinata TaxID=191078 RepID=UPI002A837A09|nr:uncharacterized protein LOC133195229 [Saccostrea echinata]
MFMNVATCNFSILEVWYMAMEGYKALKYKLNPVYFDISSDDRVKMREFVPQRKVQRSIDNLQRINEKYAVVNDFLPRWATEKYLCSLYEELTSQEARNSPTMSPEPEQIKNYIHDIIAFAKEVLQKEEAASSKVREVKTRERERDIYIKFAHLLRKLGN